MSIEQKAKFWHYKRLEAYAQGNLKKARIYRARWQWYFHQTEEHKNNQKVWGQIL